MTIRIEDDEQTPEKGSIFLGYVVLLPKAGKVGISTADSFSGMSSGLFPFVKFQLSSRLCITISVVFAHLFLNLCFLPLLSGQQTLCFGLPFTRTDAPLAFRIGFLFDSLYAIPFLFFLSLLLLCSSLSTRAVVATGSTLGGRRHGEG